MTHGWQWQEWRWKGVEKILVSVSHKVYTREELALIAAGERMGLLGWVVISENNTPDVRVYECRNAQGLGQCFTMEIHRVQIL